MISIIGETNINSSFLKGVHHSSIFSQPITKADDLFELQEWKQIYIKEEKQGTNTISQSRRIKKNKK